MPKWRTEEAFSLYKMYHDASQERFNIRKEQEFNNLLLNYEQLRSCLKFFLRTFLRRIAALFYDKNGENVPE